jgi:hypothetical protein
MIGWLVRYLLTCVPLVLALTAWTKLYRAQQWPRPIALIALGIVSANATLAAGTLLYYDLRPSPLPPWQNPQTLTLGFLILLAPVGMIVGFFAALRGTPAWLIGIVEIASVLLLAVGFLAGAAV